MMMKKTIHNERGSVMSIALLFLILLTSLVMFMSRAATTNVQISGNEKAAAAAFYNADAGAYASAKVVGKTLDKYRTPTVGVGSDYPNVSYIVSVGTEDFFDQVFFEDSGDLDDNMLFGPVRGNEDIEFFINGREVNVGVTRTDARGLAGGGNQFGTGDQGVGTGATGGVAIYFDARSVGVGPKNAIEEITVQYRKIPGTVGGL